MSSRKQVSKLSLDQIPKTIYFKKDFKLMIHSISLQQQIRSTFFTQQCANYTSIPNAHFTIAVNQVVQITTIDVTTNDEEKADLEVTLDLSHFAKGIKNDLAVTKFFVNKENILAPTSVNFYTAQMSNRKGTIEYKFVGKKTTQIDEEEYLKHAARKLEVTKLQKQLAENPQLKRLIEILDSKDEIIRQLQRKIASLIEQTRKLAHSLQREQSEQKKKLKQGLNLNLNINASNNYHMKKLNDKLTQQNEYLHKRIESLEEQLEEIDTKYMEAKYENNILHIEMGKKELEPQIIVNPTRIMANGEKRQELRKISEQEFDEELDKKSKLADSMFMDKGDDSSIKSRIGNKGGRRQNQTIVAKDPHELLIKSMTPRARGRSASVLEPQITPAFQGQGVQSKILDQDQILHQLNQLRNLKQNLQSNHLQLDQQDGSMRYPKLQAAIKSSYRMIERLNDQKLILQDKLRRRDEENDYLKRELEKSKMNFKSFEKELRERSSNAKEQFEQRMAAIKMQTQMKMAEMRKQNKFSEYENVMQQEKRQIQVEKLRYENQSLKEKYTEALNELRAIELQRNTEASKFKSTQLAINKEKQMYKSKYYEMQDSFTKQEEELSITKEKAKLYEVHVQKIEELERHEVQNKKKLEEREKANQELTRRCKRYEDKFSEIEGKWEYYRQMENEFEILKRKNYNLNKMNERFEIRVQELKKFALKLENAYYQRKAKNQTDEEFDQFYQKQLQQRLQATFRKLRQYQKQYYEEQQKQLNESKKQTIDFYLKRILDEQQRIQENIGLNEQEKTQMKKQKEEEVNHIKEQKLQELDRQIKKYEVALSKLVSSEEYMPKGLNEKITYLEEKMRKFQFGEFGAAHVSQSSQSQLKNTIDRLNDSVRAKESQITELKRTMGKMSDGGNLLKVTNIETTFANQRKSMIEEMAKSREIFSKSFDDLKRANAELLKQKSNLEIELQNYKFKQEKLILKHSQRQRQLQRMSKKNSDDFKRRIGELEKALERKSDEAIKHKLQKEEFKENMNNLISELNTTAELLQKRQQDNLNLQGENDELKNRIQQYQQAEKSLMQQVKRIKEEASFNQKQFKSLLQQRNEHFLQIQRIKNTEIQKLQRTIEEMQHKLQTQLTELLHTKQNLQKLEQQCSQLESQLQQTKVSYNIVNENYQKVEEEGVLRIHELEQTNEMLEKNMMQLAEHLKDTELQLSQLKINKESLEKQLSAIVRIKDDMVNQEKQSKLKQRKYEQIIEQQNLKLSQLQHKYQQISVKVYQVQRQNESLNIKFIEKDSEVTDLRQKLNKKYDEVNEIKSVKFDLQMHVKSLTVEIEKLQQDKLMYEEKLHVLEEDIEHLKEQLESKKPGLGVSQVTIKGQKSMLRPPPKTNLMTGSNFSQDEMEMSKMSRRSPKLLTKKQINEDDPRSNILIEEAVSLRGTQVNELNQEEHHHSIDEQIRNRMWTVNETDEHFMGVPQESRQMQPNINSRVNLHYTESQEDANLDSEMDVREGQRSQAYMRSVMLSQRLARQANQEQMHASELMKQAESLSSNAMIEQYMKEIQVLKAQNQKLSEDNLHLSEENALLKDKITTLTGNVEEVEKKNLLTSALGLTAGIFMKAGQRASVESNPNEQNPGIPVIKLKTGGNSPCLTPPIGSKETIRIEDNHSVHNHSVHNSVIRAETYSKKSSINSPSRSPKLSPRGKQAQESLRQPSNNLVFARSSVQQRSSRRQSLQGHLDQQNDKMHELQLIVQQLEEENKQLREALDEEHAANEKLMQEIVLIQEAEEEQNNMLQEKIKEVEDVNGYWEGIKEQLEAKIEKLVEEQIEKEGEEVKLLKAFEEKNDQLEQLNRKIEGYDRIILDKDKQISQLNKQIQKSYAEYRKYEEESQLQILQLKQTLTHLAQQNKSKTSEVELIAEDYFQLSNKFKELDQELKQKQQELRQRDRNIADITAMYNEATEEIKKFEELRRNTQKQIHDLENELLSQQASMTDVNKATSLSIKKYQIKLNAVQEQKSQIRQKLSDRESIIQSLKHQIALYNQQTFKLKQLNNQLSLQLQRTQKQLKDIMKSYEDQFANLNHEIQNKMDSLNQYNGYIKEKDEQISLLNKQVRKLQAETREAVDSSLETKQAYEKFRTAKMTEVSNLMAQIQVKNDEYQKLKVQYEKDTEEYFVKEGDYLKKLALSEQSKKGYKEKLLKYQTVLQELEAELSVMSQRPTKQQLDELQFQNDLYKNRIEELEQMLREFAPQAQMNKFSNSQQGIALEYKRYKMQKDRELQDLTNEIDKYALKINQLEQNNFMLKKQCEKMNEQMRELLQINAELKDENFVIKEDMHQLKEEVEFYKGKRIQNLSKLLNDTM